MAFLVYIYKCIQGRTYGWRIWGPLPGPGCMTSLLYCLFHDDIDLAFSQHLSWQGFFPCWDGLYLDS